MTEKKSKSKKKDLMQYGSLVFGIGLLIAIIASFFTLSENITKVVLATLALGGIIIGFINIRNDEPNSFLLASITLVILTGPFLGSVSQYLMQTPIINRMFGNIIALVVPAAVIVALKVLFITAHDE